MRIIVFFLLFCVMTTACNNAVQHDNGQKKKENQYELEKARKDSISKAKHDSIEQLSSTEGRHIFGDIYLGMSEREFEIAKNKFEKEVGSIDLCGLRFSILYYQIKEDKLLALTIYATQSSSIKIPRESNSVSDIEIKHSLPHDMRDIYIHFSKKYGEADSIRGLDYDYARWNYSFKIIEISSELNRTTTFGNNYNFIFDIKITYSDPSYLKRVEFERDSIKNEEEKLRQAKFAKQRDYSKQL